jgi:membrane-bound ClpP family serine protease
VRLSIAAIAVMTVLVVAFFVLVLGKGIRAQGRKVAFGMETIVGAIGTAATDIAPSGLVQMAGEQWSARATEGGIQSGEKVQVIGREGLFLIVRRRAH